MKKQRMKLCCFLLLSLLLFAACKANYRQDLSAYEIADYLETEGAATLLRQMDDNAAFFGDLELDIPFALRLAEDGSNLDEFAVFACNDAAEAKTLAKKLESYLAERYEKDKDWYLSYIPDELPKLQNAEVRTYGKYVVYAVLSQDSRNHAFDLVRQKLLQA